MKRRLLLPIAASVVTAITAQNPIRAVTLPSTQNDAVQCAPNCAPDSSAGPSSEPPSRLQLTPAARSTFSLTFLLCMSMTAFGIVIMTARARRLRRSAADREAQMLQAWAIQAALVRKRKDAGTQASASLQPEPKAHTQKQSPNAPPAPPTSECYWRYQARQVG